MTKELKELISVTEYDLNHFPDRSLKAELKSIVKKLLGRGGMVKDPIYWPNGLLAKGLTDALGSMSHEDSAYGEREKIEDGLLNYVNQWRAKGAIVEYIDDSIFGEVFLSLKDKEAADKIYANLINTRKDSEGSIVYRPKQNNNYILADMIGMVCPFLAQYGAEYNVPDAVELAQRQLLNFIRYGIDDITGLPYHGYEASGLCLGLVGWGRAVGWIMRGATGYLKVASKMLSGDRNDNSVTSESYNTIRDFYIKLTEKVLNYVREDYLFSWELPATKGHVDTSASAMIIDAFNKAMEAGIYDETPVVKDKVYLCIKKGASALLEHCVSGSVKDALSESLDFAVHYQVFGHYPWGQGPVLSVISNMKDD